MAKEWRRKMLFLNGAMLRLAFLAVGRFSRGHIPKIYGKADNHRGRYFPDEKGRS